GSGRAGSAGPRPRLRIRCPRTRVPTDGGGIMNRSPAVAPSIRRPVSFATLAFAALAFVTVACMLSAARAQSVDPAVQVRFDSEVGHSRTGPEGMTVYGFGRDEEGVSNCYDACATAWPLLHAPQVAINPLSAPGSFSLIERTDGGMQVA